MVAFPANYCVLQGEAAVLLGTPAVPMVDMVYCDPPFGNEQLWTGSAGTFDDRWTFGLEAADRLSALRTTHPVAAAFVEAVPLARSAKSYLLMIGELLIALRTRMRPAATLWLHFDDTMGAYIQVLCDLVFGVANRLGLVIWHRAASHANAKSFGRVHDTIACYGRSRVARWRLWRLRGEFTHGDPLDPCNPLRVDGFADDRLNAQSSERVGYPTQKPIALLERFIAGATGPGGLVLDPTCGSGSALCAAIRLGRRAIGLDVSADAVAASLGRLRAALPAQADLFAAVA